GDDDRHDEGDEDRVVGRQQLVDPTPLLTDERAAVAFGERRPSPAFARLSLGQVVPDVAEDVLDLAPQEDHGDDHGDGDDRDDEGVLDQALTVVLADEAVNTHRRPPFSRAASRGAVRAATRKAVLTPLPGRSVHSAPWKER